MESGNQNAQFECEVCRKTFKRRYTLDRHIKIHDQNAAVKCRICMRKYEAPETLATHMTNKHSNRPVPTCNVCKKSFASTSNLCRHRKSIHSMKPRSRLSCTVEGCDKQYLNKGHLAHHVSTEHAEIRLRFTCSLCGKEFKQKIVLDTHISTHTGEKPYKCSTCGKSFGRLHTLKQHKMVHKEKAERKQFTCHICPAIFITKLGLNLHIRSVHEKQKNYQCTLCEKKFTKKQSLSGHLEACHPSSTVPVYLCNKCEYTSSVKRNFTKHVKRHELASHECYFCAKMFTYFNDLVQHCGKIHNLEK